MSRLLLALCLLFSTGAFAQVPGRVAYQGRLLKADGTPATGALRFTFTLYDAVTGGSPLWTEEQTLALSDGLYSTHLGSVVPLTPALLSSAQRFLELKVEGEALSPRQQLGSAPYALVCQNATNVTGGTVNATAISVGGNPVITSAGRLTGAAAYEAGAGLALNGSTLSLMTGCATNQILKWTGTVWACADQATGPSNSAFIQNQTAAAQAASFRISGTAEVDGKASLASMSVGDGTTFSRMQSGTATVGPGVAGVNSVVVTFPRAFAGTPRVLVTPRSPSGNSETFSFSTRNIGSTSFSVSIRRQDTTSGAAWTQNLLLDWIATE